MVSQRLIQPSRFAFPTPQTLWDNRRLLYVLTWRDVKARYKQTFGGFLWAIIQPFMYMVVFTVLFSKVLNVSSYGIPYPIFAYAGLLPWTAFASGVQRSTNSLMQDSAIVKHLYVPRLLLPMAAGITPVVDFAIGFVVLIGMMIWYGYVPGPEVLLILPFLGLAMLFAFGLGLWLSAINVQYRDVNWGLPHLIQLGLFISPVAYGASMAKGSLYFLYQLNPMAGVIEGFRWALLGMELPGMWTLLACSAAVTAVVLIGGLAFFAKREPMFADVV